MSQKQSYTVIDRLNHWIVALAVLGLIAAGWTLSLDLIGKDEARDLRNTHKAVGVVVLIFGIWRVGWRLVTGFPLAVSGIAAWQVTASRISHYILLASLILMPISGILNGYFGGRTAKIFGLFEIAPAVEKSPALKTVFSNMHMLVGIVLTSVVLLHIAAALKHHFVDRDRVLGRMTGGV